MLINATPTAPTNQPASNIGDGQRLHPSMAGTSGPTSQPAASLSENQGPHPSMQGSLIDLDSLATTPSLLGMPVWICHT